MLRSHETILEAIGRTPLVHLRGVSRRLACPIYGKVECMNPGGSVKDRIGCAMLEAAERAGIIKPGASVIIEATAGNTGVGLAIAAAVKGYRCIFVLPDKMSREKIDLLRAYGAETVIVRTDVPPDSPDSYGGTAKRLLLEIPGAWNPDQFKNLGNPEVHYLTTGPEIWEQTAGKVTCFVAGVGTGGTISGVGRYLKEKNPAVRVVGADPVGSVLSGGAPQPWKVEGIGEDYVPRNLNSQVIDDWIRVSDGESFRAARRLAREEGLLVGGSAGTAVTAAVRYAERLKAGHLVVAMLPDTGRNYLSKFYNDDWMHEHGYAGPDHHAATAGDLLALQGPRDLISLSPDDSLEEAVRLCATHAVSQLPVLEEGHNVGCMAELTLARLLREARDPREVSIRAVMARPLPEVPASTSLDEVYRLLLSGSAAVLVQGAAGTRGLIARIDLVEFWNQASRRIDS